MFTGYCLYVGISNCAVLLWPPCLPEFFLFLCKVGVSSWMYRISFIIEILLAVVSAFGGEECKPLLCLRDEW